MDTPFPHNLEITGSNPLQYFDFLRRSRRRRTRTRRRSRGRGVGVGAGAGAGAGICLKLEPKPEISKMGGSGNPV